MKKIIFSLGLCLVVGFTSMAQDMVVVEEVSENPALVNKRGIPLLPNAGDFAIGVDATPFLKYLGNFFNKDANDAPLFNGVDNTIYGKYFIENNRAIRAKLLLNFGNDTYKGVVANDEARANNPLNADATVVDVMKQNTSNIELRVGYEFRRGRGRVQGFYGGEVGFGYGSGKQKYEYANPMTAVNQTPSTWDFAPVNPGQYSASVRPTELKMGHTIAATVAGFVGVEYFFAPQISIGGEFNLGFTYASRSQDEWTTESWNASANKVQTQTTRYDSWTDVKVDASGSPYLSRVEAGTAKLFTRPMGSIFLMFHF